MTREDLALLIAGISLGVSAATFLWRIIYDIYFDAPRLKVTLRAAVLGLAEGSAQVYSVTATNRGKRPTQLRSLWINFGRPWKWWGRLLPKWLRNKLFTGAIIVPAAKWTTLNTSLPITLNVGDQANVFYGSDDVHGQSACLCEASGRARMTGYSERGSAGTWTGSWE